MPILLVAVGGAVGSVARYLLSGFVLRLAPPGMPLGTVAVNALGCVVFGIIIGMIGAVPDRWAGSSEGRAFLLVGVLGGFTTFSAFAFDNLVLLRDGRWGLALANALGQIVIGVTAVWLGARLTS